MTATSTALTGAEVRELVKALPGAALAVLRKGPIARDEEDTHPEGDCRACCAFDAYLHGAGTPEQGQAVARLMDWHRGWDLYVEPFRERGEDGETWKLGQTPECYERCLAIYRAAGWEG